MIGILKPEGPALSEIEVKTTPANQGAPDPADRNIPKLPRIVRRKISRGEKRKKRSQGREGLGKRIPESGKRIETSCRKHREKKDQKSPLVLGGGKSGPG